MKKGDLITAIDVNRAFSFVNSVENRDGFYIKSFKADEKGNPRWIVCQLPKPTEKEIAEVEKQEAKSQRAEAIAKATVTIDGMTFNADLTALQLIACTLSIATFRGYKPDYKIKWVLACDEWTMVTLDQLARVAETAGLVIDDEWVKPYPEHKNEVSK